MRYLLHVQLAMALIVLMLYVPINNFSVMLGQFLVFLGWTITKQRVKCLAQGHKTVTLELKLPLYPQSNALVNWATLLLIFTFLLEETLIIGSRSPKPNQLFTLPQCYIKAKNWNIVKNVSWQGCFFAKENVAVFVQKILYGCFIFSNALQNNSTIEASIMSPDQTAPLLP